MSIFQPVSRRQFLKLSSSTVVGGLVAVTFGASACAPSGSSYLSSQKTQGGGSGGLQTSVSNNHGHAFVASLAELRANGEKTYDIQAGANHPHLVTITALILETLEQTKVVEVESSEIGFHTHMVKLEII